MQTQMTLEQQSNFESSRFTENINTSNWAIQKIQSSICFEFGTHEKVSSQGSLWYGNHDLAYDNIHTLGYAIPQHTLVKTPSPLHLEGIRQKCKRSLRARGWWAEPRMSSRTVGVEPSHQWSLVCGSRFARIWGDHPLLPMLLVLLSLAHTLCRYWGFGHTTEQISHCTSSSTLLYQHWCANPHNSFTQVS